MRGRAQCTLRVQCLVWTASAVYLVYMNACTCTCTGAPNVRERVYVCVYRARPLRSSRSSLSFVYACIWSRRRVAHIIWCVPVCGAKRGCSFQSGRVLCIRCIEGHNVVDLAGSIVYSVPVLFWDMMLWTIVGKGVLISVGSCIAYPFYCGWCCCSAASMVVHGVHDI